jgi:hypothetical protein
VNFGVLHGSTDGNDIFATNYLTVARFNPEWLTQVKDSLGGAKTSTSKVRPGASR